MRVLLVARPLASGLAVAGVATRARPLRAAAAAKYDSLFIACPLLKFGVPSTLPQIT
jgi:hypothetical protein